MKKKIILWLLSKFPEFKSVGTLRECCDMYAEYVCKMNGFHHYHSIYEGKLYLTKEYTAISFAFADAYMKCLRDHGLDMRNGIVMKSEELPSGAAEIYRDEKHKAEIQRIHAEYIKQMSKAIGEFNANEIHGIVERNLKMEVKNEPQNKV